MLTDLEAVLNAALALPDGDRFAIVERIMETLPPPPNWVQTSDEEFQAELIRRAEESENGTDPGIPSAEVMRILREDVDAHANR